MSIKYDGNTDRLFQNQIYNPLDTGEKRFGALAKTIGGTEIMLSSKGGVFNPIYNTYEGDNTNNGRYGEM